MLGFRPYPAEPLPGFWGEVTASDNYCEEDYLFTSYIAELINTVTNVVYLSYSLHGLWKLHTNRRLTVSSAAPLVGLIGVGVFSALFHMTLRKWPQLSDDLSMVLPTTLIFCRLLTFEMERKAAMRANARIIGSLVLLYSVHIYFNKHILHGLTFLSMVGVIANKTRRLLPVRVKSLLVRKKLLRIARFGGASFLFGFFLWNVDRRACGTLTRAKRAVGLPWGILFEFHGWWHLFTGIGAYIFIVLADYLTSDRAGDDPGDIFGWPVSSVYPIETDKQTVNGFANMNGDWKVNGSSEANGVAIPNGAVKSNKVAH